MTEFKEGDRAWTFHDVGKRVLVWVGEPFGRLHPLNLIRTYLVRSPDQKYEDVDKSEWTERFRKDLYLTAEEVPQPEVQQFRTPLEMVSTGCQCQLDIKPRPEYRNPGVYLAEEVDGKLVVHPTLAEYEAEQQWAAETNEVIAKHLALHGLHPDSAGLGIYVSANIPWELSDAAMDERRKNRDNTVRIMLKKYQEPKT